MPFSRRAFKTLLASITLLIGCAAHAKVSTVVLISVDGLSASLFNEIPHEMLLNAKTGAGPDQGAHVAAHALTIVPPVTLPAHASMLTGVDASHHHVTKDEHDADLHKLEVPSIFDLVKNNQLTSAAIVSKEKLAYLIDTGAITWLWNPVFGIFGDAFARFPSVVTYQASNMIHAHQPNFVFMHYAAVDTMGHAFGWGGFMQKMAIRRVFAAINLMLTEMRIDLHEGTYAVIITADHGGHDTAHGQTNAKGELEDPHDRDIPWVLIGANLRDPQSIVHVYDTAPTIAYLLGLDVPADWHWQGVNVAQ